MSFEFPESLLEKARAYTLADLLNNPATQCWIVSAISNSGANADSFATEMLPAEAHMIFVLKSLLSTIPFEERRVLYQMTNAFIHSRVKNKAS